MRDEIMKHATALIGIAVLLFAGPALSAAETESESAGTSEAMVQNMHEHMQKMQEQMKSIHATDEPEERKALMHEHMQAMQEGMAMLKNMETAGKHGMMDMGDMQMHSKDSQSEADAMPCRKNHGMAARHHDVQQRTRMMRQMMEQILEHQSAQEVSGE
jgi:hypothetical protein